MTTIKEITERINMWWDKDEEAEYEYYGLRFENAERQIGDTCNNSRHNPDRNDERDFPEYSSKEYRKLPQLKGSSAWHMDYRSKLYQQSYMGWRRNPISDEKFNGPEHCYIIAGNYAATHDDCDDNEVVIENAKVIAIIF